jgi:hypothetical protein
MVCDMSNPNARDNDHRYAILSAELFAIVFFQGKMRPRRKREGRGGEGRGEVI